MRKKDEKKKKKIKKQRSKVYRLEKERMMLNREAVTLESSLNFRGSREIICSLGGGVFNSGDGDSLRIRGYGLPFPLSTLSPVIRPTLSSISFPNLQPTLCLTFLGMYGWGKE